MPFEKKIIGTGMTARVTSKYILPEEPEAILQDKDNFIKSFAGFHGKYLQNGTWSAEISVAMEILRESGLPVRAGRFSEEDNGWIRWDLSDDIALAMMKVAQSPAKNFQKATKYIGMPEYSRFPDLCEIAEAKFGYESHQFFAAHLVTLANHVNLAREACLQGVVESFAYEIGRTSTMWRLKLTAESTWAIGQKLRAGGMKGADSAHGTAEAREARREEIRTAVSDGIALGMSLTAARYRAAKKLGLSYSTVRRAQSSH